MTSPECAAWRDLIRSNLSIPAYLEAEAIEHCRHRLWAQPCMRQAAGSGCGLLGCTLRRSTARPGLGIAARAHRRQSQRRNGQSGAHWQRRARGSGLAGGSGIGGFHWRCGRHRELHRQPRLNPRHALAQVCQAVDYSVQPHGHGVQPSVRARVRVQDRSQQRTAHGDHRPPIRPCPRHAVSLPRSKMRCTLSTRRTSCGAASRRKPAGGKSGAPAGILWLRRSDARKSRRRLLALSVRTHATSTPRTTMAD